MYKIKQIRAREWVKTLTEDQLNATSVVLRDNWGDAIVGPGELRNLLKNWICPWDWIDIDKTKIANGSGSVYFGNIVPEHVKRCGSSLFGNRSIDLTQKDIDRLKNGEVICIPGEKWIRIGFTEEDTDDGNRNN